MFSFQNKNLNSLVLYTNNKDLGLFSRLVLTILGMVSIASIYLLWICICMNANPPPITLSNFDTSAIGQALYIIFTSCCLLHILYTMQHNSYLLYNRYEVVLYMFISSFRFFLGYAEGDVEPLEIIPLPFFIKCLFNLLGCWLLLMTVKYILLFAWSCSSNWVIFDLFMFNCILLFLCFVYSELDLAFFIDKGLTLRFPLVDSSCFWLARFLLYLLLLSLTLLPLFSFVLGVRYAFSSRMKKLVLLMGLLVQGVVFFFNVVTLKKLYFAYFNLQLYNKGGVVNNTLWKTSWLEINKIPNDIELTSIFFQFRQEFPRVSEYMNRVLSKPDYLGSQVSFDRVVQSIYAGEDYDLTGLNTFFKSLINAANDNYLTQVLSTPVPTPVEGVASLCIVVLLWLACYYGNK